ncbi:hypothetical protein Q1695_004025 [Nippostrongylus brasiliensis]|nr:hypothetical protein Q1695_004025 [Nippostrongylus brasiliensis]
MHLCERQTNLTRRACCQLVLLLNDTTTVPLCDIELLAAKNGSSSRIYSPPILLDEPSDVEEDHLTFLLGITILILVALGCIVAVSRLGKPRFMISYGNIANYDFMMWMPTKQNRRSSMLVYLRGISCRRPSTANRNSNISVVSSNIGLLPSYQSATSTPTSALSSFPPPPYSAERQRLTDDSV